MKNCLIIGKVNTGKSLFALNFAQYLGNNNIFIKKYDNDGKESKYNYSIYQAKKILTSNKPFETENIQIINININIGNMQKKISLIDSTGLIDGIHKNIEIRKSLSQTISIINKNKNIVIFHVIDATSNKSSSSYISEIDYVIAKKHVSTSGYALLLNKIDLINDFSIVKNIERDFPHNTIYPMSSKYKLGFRRIEQYLMKKL